MLVSDGEKSSGKLLEKFHIPLSWLTALVLSPSLAFRRLDLGWFSCRALFLTCLSLSLAEVRCPAPPSIANGQHSGRPGARHGLGSVVLYSCAPGYSLVGNASIHCTAKGTWSRPQPRCQGVSVCLPPPVPGLFPPSWLLVHHCSQILRERQRAEMPHVPLCFSLSAPTEHKLS